MFPDDGQEIKFPVYQCRNKQKKAEETEEGKMTFTVRKETVGRFYICIEQEKYSCGYKVEACRKYADGTCGYPIRQNYYATLREAKRRFSYLKRKAAEDDL